MSVMSGQLENLVAELSKRDVGSSIRYFREGNAWLPYPFIGVTRYDGVRYALYFRDGDLFYVPADAGTVRPAIAISRKADEWNPEAIVDRVHELEEKFSKSKQSTEPSFTVSKPSARKTSESLHKLRYNWLIPIFSGAFLFLALVLVSIGTTNLSLGGPGVSQPSNSPPPVSTIQQPSPPSPLPSQPLRSGSGEFGSFDRSPGSIVICNDGTVSHSGGKRGACSWHGGVR